MTKWRINQPNYYSAAVRVKEMDHNMQHASGVKLVLSLHLFVRSYFISGSYIKPLIAETPLPLTPVSLSPSTRLSLIECFFFVTVNLPNLAL